jgi:glycogen operon protein
MAESAWHAPYNRTLGMYLAGAVTGSDDDGNVLLEESFLVLLHAGDKPEPFTLPDQPYGREYQRVIDTATGQAEPSGPPIPAGSVITLRPRQLVALRAIG